MFDLFSLFLVLVLCDSFRLLGSNLGRGAHLHSAVSAEPESIRIHTTTQCPTPAFAEAPSFRMFYLADLRQHLTSSKPVTWFCIFTSPARVAQSSCLALPVPVWRPWTQASQTAHAAHAEQTKFLKHLETHLCTSSSFSNHMLYPYGLIVVLLSTRRSLHVTLVKILLPKKKKTTTCSIQLPLGL